MMNFPKRGIACLAALACMFFAACADRETQKEVEDEPTVPPISEPDEIEQIDAQLELLADQKAVWLDSWLKEETPSEPYSFAVTDLDHNGRLEVISSTCQGTGLYSQNTVWEVNETLDALVLCTQDHQETDSQADMVATAQTTRYYDADSGLYHYIFQDTLRNGAAEYYENVRAVTLENGAVSEQILAYRSTIYVQGGNEPTITCTDSESNPISQEEYDTIASEVFGDLEAATVAFHWISTASVDFNEVEQDSLRQLLTESYRAFAQ